jgi:hypothetical protein
MPQSAQISSVRPCASCLLLFASVDSDSTKLISVLGGLNEVVHDNYYNDNLKRALFLGSVLSIRTHTP